MTRLALYGVLLYTVSKPDFDKFVICNLFNIILYYLHRPYDKFRWQFCAVMLKYLGYQTKYSMQLLSYVLFLPLFF